MKTLLIVESPAKSKTIVKYLGNDYIVLASFGHIRNLSKEKMGIDIEKGFVPCYELLKEKSGQVKEIREAIKKVDRVLLAADDDREGEAIAWHCAMVFKLDIREKNRICFHEITKQALEEAVANPRTIDMNKVNSQQSRRMLDRIVGFSLSPVLWKYVMPKLSAGRVQSCALKLVADNEKECKNFKGGMYYKTTGDFILPSKNGNKDELILQTILNKECKKEEEIMVFLQDCKESVFQIAKLEEKDVERSPSPPYVTSSIQQDCGIRFGMSSKSCMGTLQKLYEGGLITYHRTDSTLLSSLIQNEIKSYVLDKFGKKYFKLRQYKSKVKCAQEAHEAIRPTHILKSELGEEWSEYEKKVYALIWKRTVASQMANAEYKQYIVDVSISKRNELFIGKIEKLLFSGYKAVYDDLIVDDDSESNNTSNQVNDELIALLKVNLTMDYKKIVVNEKYEGGPTRYNEAGLIKKMEKVGIGRPSTYSNIIETLLEREYVKKGDVKGVNKKVKEWQLLPPGNIKQLENTIVVGAEKKKLLITDVGQLTAQFLETHFTDIVQSQFTANMEQELDNIVNGEASWLDVMNDFYGKFKVSLDEMKTQDSKAVKEDRKRFLGMDASGNNISVYVGKFGPVIEFEKEGQKKYMTLPSNMSVEKVQLDKVLQIETYPQSMGRYQEKEVLLCKGKYGFYISYDGKNHKLLEGMTEKTITIEHAIQCITNEKQSKVLKKIGKYSILNGKFGLCILCDSKFYSLPNDVDIEALCEERCKEIVSQNKKGGCY